MRYHDIPTEIAQIKDSKDVKYQWGCIATEIVTCHCENAKWHSPLGKEFCSLLKN